MELMFLNESANGSEVDELVAYCETAGISLEGIESQDYLEVCLESETKCGLAEIQAMREEFSSFKMYNEEAEGVWAKVVTTLKKWWTALKEGILKVWFAITNFATKLYAKARELVQRGYAKVTGKSDMTIAPSVKAAAEGFKAANIVIPSLDSVKAIDEAIKKMQEDSKVKTAAGDATEKITMEAWKTLIKEVVAKLDASRKDAVTLKAKVVADIKANDKALADLEKTAGTATDEASKTAFTAARAKVVENGNVLSATRKLASAVVGAHMKQGWSVLNKLFSGIKTAKPAATEASKEAAAAEATK